MAVATTVAPDSGRTPSPSAGRDETRGDDGDVRTSAGCGGRGGAPLIAASWQRRAGWERPAPQPLTVRLRTNDRLGAPASLPLAVECAVVRRQWRFHRNSCNTSTMFRWSVKFSQVNEKLFYFFLHQNLEIKYRKGSLYPGFGFIYVNCDIGFCEDW